MSSSGQVNFEIPLGRQDRFFYSSLTQDGHAIFSYDNGMIDVSKTKLNFFSSFQTTRNFKEQIYKVGVRCIRDNFNYGLRVKYNSRYAGIWSMMLKIICFFTPKEVKRDNGIMEDGGLISLVFTNLLFLNLFKMVSC